MMKTVSLFVCSAACLCLCACSNGTKDAQASPSYSASLSTYSPSAASKAASVPTIIPTAEPTAVPVPTAESTGIDPSFKAAMDAYEAFFNEYVTFMQKYQNAEDTASMLSDYLQWMNKYKDTMTKLDSIDENALSSADQAYYLEVMARILNRLAEVQ
ncbi:MAG: hypothetical protein LKF53_07460 [Solobacterium sp.]|jgi:hypothetical protein|nr:hypothetical protein [Solobacterium sp.]MCH4206212.1 hypothetical protein [Solobacterium sp.]MCH4227678.1 hypothetical protein [Solobacterium sp.]MCH4283105.1 hypothetical protein [Solobacterium sp.]